LAGDLKALIEHLDLSGVVLGGFSVSCVEVTRYLVTSGSERVRKPPFGAIPPHLLNTDNDPEGVEVFFAPRARRGPSVAPRSARSR
jgi:non-heme chloroperoxidase